ncbi:MBL fold metallo-hydrolase [Brevibacterium sp. UCMA 11754]|uniref:MBL fold metallo-hydrolase n=1 Tax=Brevibacterium sp. UCMA 11754 TaxID=2749198 RepID=UPI001F34C96B|nr:MBL fold metallo-hydrolase [Brevibacterium sp. UCMA 11754]MCF2571119.1 MBL fold metallo-hydrolase [Brevibacterium sp. UCMA 11754]
MTSLALDVYVSPMLEMAGGGHFSPTSSTIIFGADEAIVVDTPYTRESVDEVIERIERSGRRLTAILVTHGHWDHYFGLDALLERFPEARAWTIPSVAASITDSLDQDRADVRQYFDGAALDNSAVPEALEGDEVTVDGEPVRLIELEQADISPTAIVHIPGLQAVIAGDAVYNGIHPFLAVTGPAEWQRWLASIDELEALAPKTVVAGHKRAEARDNDLEATITATRAYIDEFSRAVEEMTSSRDVIEHMQSEFPDHDNPSALILSASTAMKRKKAASSHTE